jgi:hypothetical protein
MKSSMPQLKDALHLCNCHLRNSNLELDPGCSQGRTWKSHNLVTTSSGLVPKRKSLPLV